MISYLKGRPIITQQSVIIVTGEQSIQPVQQSSQTTQGHTSNETRSQQKSIINSTSAVGYNVHLGPKTKATLSSKLAELFIYTHVREDRIELYGFNSQQQQYLFELMINVSGVGPKTAIEITDHNPEAIISAVQNSEVSFFKAIPRIGKKTAQKIILELKPKLGSLKELSLGPRSSQEQDLYEALAALGYEEANITPVVSSLNLENLTLEVAVKKVLKQLG